MKSGKLIYISIEPRQLATQDMQPVQKTAEQPNLESIILFLAVGFDPATVHSKQRHATRERRMV